MPARYIIWGEHMDWEAKCRELQNRIAELEKENRFLQSIAKEEILIYAS